MKYGQLFWDGRRNNQQSKFSIVKLNSRQKKRLYMPVCDLACECVRNYLTFRCVDASKFNVGVSTVLDLSFSHVGYMDDFIDKIKKGYTARGNKDNFFLPLTLLF